jgi:hypothetical protein
MHNIGITQHDLFAKRLIMVLHNEELLSRLSDSEISLCKFISDNKGYLVSHIRYEFGMYKTWWRFMYTQDINNEF